MFEHAIVQQLRAEGDKPMTVIRCKCGAKITAETEEEAVRRHRVHFMGPVAAEGIAAAREAIEQGRRPKERPCPG